MPCRGVLFALDKTELATLVAIKDQEDRIEHVSNEIEERFMVTQWAAETDKAWDAIHRCFDNGELTWEGGDYPLNHIILGGKLLTDGEEYIITLKTPKQVGEIAAEIGKITKTKLKARYKKIGKDYDRHKSNEDFEYTWEWFAGLIPFFENAAKAKRAVIFTVDL